MTPIAKLYFSAFIIISFELVLMVYIYMLQPKQRSNQLFAVYMLMLSVSSYNILVASTASDVATVYIASRVHALAIMIATPLLWLLVLQVFTAQYRFTRWATPPLLILAILPLAFGLLDWVSKATLLFEFVPELYSGGYVRIHEVLNGRLGGLFYTTYVITLNSLLAIPLFLFAFTRLIPERQKRAARVLVLFFLGVLFLYVPRLNISLALRNMLTPIFAALGTAWVVNSYRFFSPIELAMKQVVDTVTIGLLVFDEQLILTDANAFSAKLLPVKLPQDILTLSLPQLLQRMLPEMENREELIQLSAAVKLKPEEVYSQEIVLHVGRSSLDPATIWILFNIRPVYDDNNLYLGLSCSIEDLTVERRTQAYIAETHKAIEQYAYNQALLNDITQAAINALDFKETLSILASRLVALLKADHCYISLLDQRSQQLVPSMAYGVDVEAYLSIKLHPDEPSIVKEVCRQKQVIPIEDCHQSVHVNQRIARMFPTRGMLALPMRADGQDLGALLIGFKNPRKFPVEEIKWGEQIARQAALVIYKNRLLEVERKQRELLEALQASGRALTSTLDFEQVLDRILDEIAPVVPYDTANFALVDKAEACIVRSRGFDKYGSMSNAEATQICFDIDQTPTFRTMFNTKRPFCISDTTSAPEWKQLEGVDHIKSWLGVPLVVADQVVAFLSVDKIEVHFYQAQHEEGLAAFASQAALALQNAQLFTEIQRRVTELEALSVVSAAFRSAEPMPNVLQAVLSEMVDILSARIGVAFLLNEEKTAVISQGSYPNHFYPDGIRYNLGEGITGKVAQTGEIHISTNINLDPLQKLKIEEPEVITQLRSSIALPLISEEGILGVIHLGLDTIYEFADDEIHTLKAISNIIANDLTRIRVMQTLETRVTNRTYDLKTANERLQELDKLKTKFIADVSHELRTPVANLSLYVDLLQHGRPEKQEHYMTVLQQQANRLTNLVEATLGLSHLEIGTQSLTFSSTNLNDIVEQTVSGQMARVDALNLQLDYSLQPDLPLVWGNSIQLTQLVTNLLSNAINYTPEGTVHIETLVENEKTVCLKVIDSGIGISQSELPHLFERFYRGHRTGQSNIPGTGLGLAIVNEIVNLHKGKIEVTSQSNKGSQFLVYLPVDKFSSQAADETEIGMS